MKETRRIRDEAAQEARTAAERAKKAEEEARTAAVDLAKAKAAGKIEEAEKAKKKVVEASKKAVAHKKKAVSAAREGLERAHSVGAKLAKGLQEDNIAAKHVKQRARYLEDRMGHQQATKDAPPPDINEFAKKLSRQLGAILEEKSQLVQDIRRVIRFRAHLEGGLRTDLISGLRRISRIADELATGLRS